MYFLTALSDTTHYDSTMNITSTETLLDLSPMCDGLKEFSESCCKLKHSIWICTIHTRL